MSMPIHDRPFPTRITPGVGHISHAQGSQKFVKDCKPWNGPTEVILTKPGGEKIWCRSYEVAAEIMLVSPETIRRHFRVTGRYEKKGWKVERSRGKRE